MKSYTPRRVLPVILLALLAIVQPASAQFIQGNVILADGSAPPKPVTIERICAGAKFPEGVTDKKGHFRFDLGRFSSTVADASVSDPGAAPGLTNPGEEISVTEKAGRGGGGRIARETMAKDSQSCELRAVLAGYYPALIDMAGTTGSLRDLGTITLRPIVTPQDLKGRGAVEERAKNAKTPPPAKELTEAEKTLANARLALKQNKTTEAMRELEHLVQLEPANAQAWYLLGTLYQEQDRRADASKSYTSAIAADATLVGPYVMLAGLQAQDQKWKELAETTSKLIQINPVDVPAAYLYQAVANYNLGDLDQAEKAARQGIQIDTKHQLPRLHHILGGILADDRNFAEAIQQMNLYLKYAPDAKDRSDALKLVGEWTSLALDPPAVDKPQ